MSEAKKVPFPAIILSKEAVALPEYFSGALSLSAYWRIVWPVVNPQLDSCKHINTLCGIFLLYPSLTELSSLEIKRGTTRFE